jgi:hypothetical protein
MLESEGNRKKKKRKEDEKNKQTKSTNERNIDTNHNTLRNRYVFFFFSLSQRVCMEQ